MVNFKVEISKLIAEQVADLTAEEIQSMIEVPQDTKMGDYAFPCFKLAKTLRKAPPLIAKEIAEAISGNTMFAKVEQVNAYVNMFISRESFVGDVVTSVLTEDAEFGKTNLGNGANVVVDFSSPNIAKPFHIGHLCSTIIGDSLSSDIQGANNAGLPCCWFNLKGEARPDDLTIDYEIRDLRELYDIV